MLFTTKVKIALVVGFVGLLGLVLLVAAVAPQGSARGDTLVYALYDDIQDWDPASAFSTEVFLLANVYETLVRYEPAGEGEDPLRPLLAESWSVSDGGLAWTFQLRGGVTFHDGTPLDASAAKASLERTISLGRGAAYIWDGVESIEAPDARTLIIRTIQPMPIDLIASSQYGAYLYSPTAAAEGREWFQGGRAAGTGPYQVRLWRPGQQIVLERFEGYRDAATEYGFSRVLLKIVQERSTQVQLLLSGQADFISTAPVDLMPALRQSPEVNVEGFASWKNSQFLLNTQKPPTDNRLFRQAILMAWDYDVVVEQIHAGAAQVSRGIIPAGIWGHDPNLPTPTFDLEEARRLVEASGVAPEDRRLEIAFIGSQETYQNAALLLQENLASIGVEVELRPGPWGQIWDEAKNLRTAPNLISMTWWPTYPTPSDWLVGLFRTEAETLFNLSHYQNPTFDALVAEGLAAEATDREAAIRAYRAAQRVLVDDAVAIFYADIEDRIIHRTDVTGFEPNPAYNAVFFHQLERTP